MIRDINGSTRHTTSQECDTVYQYLRLHAAIQSPPELIQEFQNLLQQGKNENHQVSLALEKIIFAPKPQFYLFLNHCFYLIWDCWLETPDSMLFVGQLFSILGTISNTKSYDRRRKYLVRLIRDYQQTEFYLQLKALIAIINPLKIEDADQKNTVITNEVFDSESDHQDTLINSYLVRYTFLYQCFLPSKEQFNHLFLLLEKLRDKRQHDFEILLSKHIIYRVRLKQFAKMKLLAKGAGKAIVQVDNPSLLSERAFRIALKQYTGKIDDKSSILEQTQHFVAENKLRTNYQEFKRDLYCFIAREIKPRNNTYRFKSRFKQKIVNIFAQSDAKSINRTLILQTCRQLFSYLLVDPASSNNPQRFAELVANLGTAQVMMILVKIVLICPESKSDLEKKLCLVVSHYQLQSVQENFWLIKSLEHLLMAFSIYFGQLDVSLAKSALSKS